MTLLMLYFSILLHCILSMYSFPSSMQLILEVKTLNLIFNF
jgi:hypothetical protein